MWLVTIFDDVHAKLTKENQEIANSSISEPLQRGDRADLSNKCMMNFHFLCTI